MSGAVCITDCGGCRELASIVLLGSVNGGAVGRHRTGPCHTEIGLGFGTRLVERRQAGRALSKARIPLKSMRDLSYAVPWHRGVVVHSLSRW